MVNVNFNQAQDGFSVSLRGHAGYGTYGKDIVCAAVSALCIALEIALIKNGVPEKCTFYENADDGLYEIVVRRLYDGELKAMCKNFLYMFFSGMVFLQEHYPENICVKGIPLKKGRHGISQMPEITERKEGKGWIFS